MEKDKNQCNDCAYYQYDDDTECYVCEINLDEDEIERFMAGSKKSCPYFKFYDEYKMVEKQN
ncbi:MAG: DUF6472 family protein [Bacillota bacterium]|nr:DUF6472 family protein [Bacillota bacterium]